MLKGVHLTLMVGPGIPVPVPYNVIEALTAIEVEIDAQQPGSFSLTFNLSQRSPLHTIFLLTGGSLPPVMRVVIIATINGQTEVLIDGVMTEHQVTPNGENGMTTLTISGDDLTRVMDMVDLDGLPYPAMPPELRVAAAIAKYAPLGLIPMVVPAIFRDVESPLDRVSLHKGTDLDYIRCLAKAAGHVFYLEAGPVPLTTKAYWGPEIKIGVPQPALNLDMDSFRNVESLKFRIDNSAHVQPVLNVSLPIVKKSVPIPVPNVSLLNPPLGAVPIPATNTVNVNCASRLSMTKALLKGLSVASQSADQVFADGTLDVVRYGRILKARRLVGVRGAGLAFDGLYYVRKVTHQIRRGEYKQQFTLSRNGLVSTVPRVPA